jgi:Cu2+-exporting ATPase
VTVLVIACPHALGLAIPLVVALSTSITAKSGILIRDRKAFETVRDIDVVVFDKTGTLTEGKFGVSDVVSFIPEKELLEFVSAVEVNSEHIIAKAIVDYTNKKKIMIPKISEFKAIPGKGAQGKVNGRIVIMGSPSLLDELEIKITDERIIELQKQGKTVVFAILDGKLGGAFALSDKIREVSKEAVRKLKENGKCLGFRRA